MQELHAIRLVVQGSRFFAHLYAIQGEEDIQEILKRHRKKYRKADHHCWAIRLMAKEKLLERSKNDGEVGQPGKVLLGLLRKHGLTGYALVVSRIFGGKKLGVGGVSRAFKEVGEETLKYGYNTIEIRSPREALNEKERI